MAAALRHFACRRALMPRDFTPLAIRAAFMPLPAFAAPIRDAISAISAARYCHYFASMRLRHAAPLMIIFRFLSRFLFSYADAICVADDFLLSPPF